MRYLSEIQVFGDSILKGIQLNTENLSYYIKNDINYDLLAKRFRINIKNDSRFGCTVLKGALLMDKKLERGLTCDAVIMDFGGNDCDYNWKAISENPDNDIRCNVPLSEFVRQYKELIRKLKTNGITPILTTLPPLDAQKFFDWWCRGLNKENVMKWLGSVSRIYTHQESYSKEVEKIAREEKVPIVDIREAFLRHGNIEELLCEDGTHPNSKGQKIITEALERFAEKYVEEY